MSLRTGSSGCQELSLGRRLDPRSRLLHQTGCLALACFGHLIGYLGKRLNHISRYTYAGRSPGILGMADKDSCEGFPADGTVEDLGEVLPRSSYHHYRYTEGPRDKAFMEQKDREYLTALKDSDDPAMQARFEEELATLDLSLEHHRNLKREFEPFTRAYREAAGGGGEGGGGEPPAWEAKIAELKEETEQRITRLSRERDEDRATTAALRDQANEQAERLSTSQARVRELEASLERLRNEHAEAVTLRRQLTERLSASEAQVERLQRGHSETHAAVEDHARRLTNAETERAAAEQRLSTIAERLEAVRTDLRSRLEASSSRLDELASSHDSALTTLTRSLETQKRNLLRNIHGLDQRLHRLAGRARHEEHRSHQLHASHERLTASMALAGHLIVPVKHTAIHLGDRLGQGSLMETHRATWQDMPCAYKQLRTPPPTDAAAMTFQREVLALSGMKHPRVTLPYAYTQKPYGLLMPHRVALSARIQAGALNADMCCRLAHDMAQGLAYLHSQDQVHGHLKPANILLDGEERASLSDFGLSRSHRYTTVEDVAYRAPESLRRQAVNDQRSDVYGLGMVLWSMATGKAPFATAPDLATLRGWIASGEKETWPEAIPAAYKATVEQCWSAPERRPRAQDLVRTFAGLMGSPVEPPRAADAGPSPSPSV